ncbi:hypothetical protein J1N35_032613 [Gossypium stocksii]|uniref:30S ribosomal protein S8, chloroplastic n=1 Tax=Gossypium stocksii TaxID=47602 RepID=A0A9D3ZUW4_9ROSI|nr:hypothetical protein J1N35_032613 [Gossypium stocksii]
MGRRILNDALRSIVNAERRGKATVELKPISTVISSFLNIMKYRGYIKNFEVHDPHRVGRITVDLQGRVNDCRALTYRQDIKAKDIEKYKTLKLPTRQNADAAAMFVESACLGRVRSSSLILNLFIFLLRAVGLCCDFNSGWCFGS